MIARPALSASRLTSWLTSLAIVAIILVFGAPFLWVLAQAFDAATTGALPWPGELTLANVRTMFEQEIVRVALRNSLIVAGVSAVLATLLAGLAGFGLSRISFRRKAEVMYGIILLYAFPLTVTMVAIFDVAIRLDLTNTLRGLILAEVAIMLPFLTWLMKGFYDAIPRQLDEAALIDGASIWRSWLGVIAPAALPGIGTAAGLAFVIAWSEPLLPIVLISDPDLTTVSRFFFAAATSSTSFQSIAALGIAFLAPVLLVILLLRGVIGSSVMTSIDER
ncbi:MAG: carbohydrate ABC transporter permease [Thermomicrobiales bacterium]|nr:carbohydrate ABC transporter permease [Thermomicrobiales bacterium]